MVLTSFAELVLNWGSIPVCFAVSIDVAVKSLTRLSPAPKAYFVTGFG
jgi:hypothetical protein